MTNGLLTVRDVAAALKVSTRHIWKLHASGQLPAAVRVGRCVRWRAGQLRAWIEAGCPSRDKWRALQDAKDVQACV